MLTWGLYSLQFPLLPPGVHHCKDKLVKTHSVNSEIYKQVQRTYVDALVKASFLTPNCHAQEEALSEDEGGKLKVHVSCCVGPEGQ